MAIPKYEQCMRPILELAADGVEYSMADARTVVARKLNTSETEAELIPSGGQPRFTNNVSWANTTRAH